MTTLLRGVAAAVLVAAFTSPCLAQPNAKPVPEPLPLGVPYYYQPGNPYWFRVATPMPSPYPFGATIPIYGRYAWDYTGQFTGITHYPYSYQFPTIYGWTWLGYTW